VPILRIKLSGVLFAQSIHEAKTSNIGLTKNIIFIGFLKCLFKRFKLPGVPAGALSIIYYLKIYNQDN